MTLQNSVSLPQQQCQLGQQQCQLAAATMGFVCSHCGSLARLGACGTFLHVLSVPDAQTLVSLVLVGSACHLQQGLETGD